MVNLTDSKLMIAVVAGATGAVGRDVVRALPADDRCERVEVLVRRPFDAEHPKLRAHVVDFERPETWRDAVRGDVLMLCMGTSRAAAGSKAAQWRVDFTYQYRVAEAAVACGVKACVLVSSADASDGSRWFYLRMKGELETELSRLGFARLAVVRPPVLVRRGSRRMGERMSVAVLRALAAAGILRRMRPMPTATVARAMVRLAAEGRAGVFEGEALWRAAGE